MKKVSDWVTLEGGECFVLAFRRSVRRNGRARAQSPYIGTVLVLVIESRQPRQNTYLTTIDLGSIAFRGCLLIETIAHAFDTKRSLEGLLRHARNGCVLGSPFR